MDQVPDILNDCLDPPLNKFSRISTKAGAATPWLTIPGRAIVSVEHPCIIKNFDKGLHTMGDDLEVQKLVETEDRHQFLNLYLRPDDAMCKPIRSQNVKTNNLLVKVTVPKRTGRKRKRGSTEPYSNDVEAPQSTPSLKNTEAGELKRTTAHENSVEMKAAQLLQSLRDNIDKFKVEPVGTIEQTHRFRGMPDFQYSSTKSPFMNKMRDHILSYDYASMKKFKLDPSKGIKLNDEIIPPPSFSHMYTPINYGYHQNPAVKTAIGSTGHLVTGNTQSPVIVHTQLLPWNAETVPSTPDSSLTPFEKLDRPLQTVVEHLRTLLDERPLWTRRAFANVLADRKFGNLLRQGFQYAGYMFRSGPWNNSVIKFGVDPRSNPKYRFYQTLMFQLKEKEPKITHKGWEDNRLKNRRLAKKQKKDNKSHLFNGRNVVLTDGKTWQVCDISDPLLKQLLSTDNIRSKCDIEGDGWYHNGTLAKIKTIMKAKIRQIVEGRTLSDADFISVMNLPDIIDDVSRAQAILNKKEVSMQEVRWASDVRTVMKKPAPRTESDINATVDFEARSVQESEGQDNAQKEATHEMPVDARVAEAMLELEDPKQTGRSMQASIQDEGSFGAFRNSRQENYDDEDPSEDGGIETNDEGREDDEDEDGDEDGVDDDDAEHDDDDEDEISD
ncbi:MAG: hypothetical protein M1812_001420 [Candelaria pacifica]|nr:MAG: hypothetical protein M1812_001420 [Candelaria pacifica]